VAVRPDRNLDIGDDSQRILPNATAVITTLAVDADDFTGDRPGKLVSKASGSACGIPASEKQGCRRMGKECRCIAHIAGRQLLVEFRLEKGFAVDRAVSKDSVKNSMRCGKRAYVSDVGKVAVKADDDLGKIDDVPVSQVGQSFFEPVGLRSH